MTSRFQKHKNHGNMEANFIEVANYLYSHYLLIAISALACASVMGIWSFFFKKDIYSSKASISINIENNNPLSSAVGSSYWSKQADVENKLYVISVYMRSTKFKTALGKEALGQSNITKKYPKAKVAKKIVKQYLEKQELINPNVAGEFLSGMVYHSVDVENRILNVASKSESPLLTWAVSNLAALVLVEINYDTLVKEMDSVVEFIKVQTKIAQDNLYSLEEELAKVQRAEKVISMQSVGALVDEYNVETKNSIQNLKIALVSNQNWISELKKSIDEFKNAMNEGGNSHLYYMQIQQRLDLLKYQRALKKAGRHPAAISSDQVDALINKTVDELQGSFQNLEKRWLSTDPWEYLKGLESSLINAQKKNAELVSQIRAHDQVNHDKEVHFKHLPTVFKRISQLKRSIDIRNQLYQHLKKKLQETQIEKAGKANDLSILLYATQPTSPDGLNIWQKFILSLLGGSIVLVLLLSLRYFLIPTIRSRGDLQRMGVDVIAEVPFARFSSKSSIDHDHAIILRSGLLTDEATAIRHARFNLESHLQLRQRRDGETGQLITVCSANSKEGKSFITSNLAYAVSLTQIKTLVIDLDIFNPTLHKYLKPEGINETEFDSENSFLNQSIASDLFFNSVSVNSFLDLATPHGADENFCDIIETPYFEKYLNEIKKHYDLIFIDTPPIRNSLEPLIVSKYSDAMVYVVNQRSTLRYDVLKTIDVLNKTYENDVLAILNFSYDELNSSSRRVSKLAS